VQLIRRTTVLAALAAALASAATAAVGLAQEAAKANYEAGASFELPAKGQPGGSERPSALAFSPDRLIHIADERGLVYVYDSTGVYQRSYGQGHLDRPIALALSAANEAYVLDSGRKQIFVFDRDGRLLRTLAEKGDRRGQLSNPLDFALGHNGYLYVLDPGRNGIQMFSYDGTFVRDIVLADIREPLSLAVGIDGSLYIAEKRSPGHVYSLPAFTKLPWSGARPRGSAGRIDLRGASLDEPVATAVNHFGTVVVLDKKSGRIFGKNPFSRAEVGSSDFVYGGSGSGRGSFRDAVDLAYAGPNRLLILDGRLRKVERIRLTTEDQLSPRPELKFPIRVTRVAESLPAPLLAIGYTRAGEPRFLLAPEKRTASLTGTLSNVRATVYGDSVRTYVPNNQQQLRLSAEFGDVVAGAVTDSTAIILDRRRNRFAVFELKSGRLQGTYGDNYRDQRRLRNPHGIAILNDGRVVVADTDNDRLKIFSADLASLLGSYPVTRPAGVAVAPDGMIVVWSEDGALVGRLVFEEGTIEPLAEGALERPSAMHVDRDGNIYLSDDGSQRTLVYRWDVQFPALAGIDLEYQDEGAILSWSPGPPEYTQAYEVQGGSPFRIDTTNIPETPPRYVRVAPVFITGVTGRASEPRPLTYFAAEAAFRRGDHSTAMQDASETVRLIENGILTASERVKGRLLYIGFASAYDMRDFNLALEWARQAATTPMPREQIISFLFRLAEIYLQLGYPEEASQRILQLVGQGPRPEHYTDGAVVDQSFRIHRQVRDTGHPEDALEFMRLYAQSIPASVPDLQAQYRDSITVFSTRVRLGRGFRYWGDADYTQVVTFFEGLVTQGGLNTEQEVISRQLLAAAYYAFGRRGEAEDTYRKIFAIRPGFNLSGEIQRLQRLYGLTIYSPQTLQFFGNLRRGS
jgi:DNA-binding beta-propeller fold protein YncE/tetratricopeptide (TPR) repeat protein